MRDSARSLVHRAAAAAAALTVALAAPAAAHEEHEHLPHHWESPGVRGELTGQTGILLLGWLAAAGTGRLLARKERERC